MTWIYLQGNGLTNQSVHEGKIDTTNYYQTYEILLDGEMLN